MCSSLPTKLTPIMSKKQLCGPMTLASEKSISNANIFTSAKFTQYFALEISIIILRVTHMGLDTIHAMYTLLGMCPSKLGAWVQGSGFAFTSRISFLIYV